MFMKQHLITIENSKAKTFENEINALLVEGYEVKSTYIGGREVGTYNEWSVYQAIPVKDVIDKTPHEHVKVNFKFNNKQDKELD